MAYFHSHEVPAISRISSDSAQNPMTARQADFSHPATETVRPHQQQKVTSAETGFPGKPNNSFP